jgi:hypothetical protein
LLRVVTATKDALNPSAKMPRVLFPAADPQLEAAEAAAAEPLVSQA